MDKRKNKHIAYLSIGTNLGDKNKNIENAVKLLGMKAGTIIKCSKTYKTEAWNMNKATPAFYNIALAIETGLSPFELLHISQSIETMLGRTAKSINNEYRNRLIDIDILMIDNMVLTTQELIIPHPLLHKRNFVLYPLSEIAPSAIHPLLNKTILELKEISDDAMQVSLV